MAILVILAKMANLDGVNGEKSPEGWQFKLDAKEVPWRVTILAIMAKMAKLAIFAKMAELAKIANLEHSPLREWRF